MVERKNVSPNNPIKIVLAGDGATGKSTLLKVKNTGTFDYSCNLTIGVDFGCLNLKWRDKEYPLLVYDLGGQKRFQFLHDSYILGTKAAIILYDLTRKITFTHLSQWLELLSTENSEMPLIIAGSKLDLVPKEVLNKFQILWEKNQPKWVKYNICGHYFISSKKNEGLDEIFSGVLRNLQNIPYFPPMTKQCINCN
jgi:small GTP-binding protein